MYRAKTQGKARWTMDPGSLRTAGLGDVPAHERRTEKPLKLRLISPFPRRERVTMHPALPNIAWRKSESQPAAERARRSATNGRAGKPTQFLTSFTDLITATVATGEDVAISGFAKFRRIDRPARMARNPATGEQVGSRRSASPASRR